MSTDSNGLTDGVTAELNPAVGDDAGEPQLKRPPGSAGKAAWVDYCVALGADRDRLEGRTAHYGVVPHESGVGLTNGYATPPALAKEELVDLADRLGG
jgi:hypothetical protein